MKRRVLLNTLFVICLGTSLFWLAAAALAKCLPAQESARGIRFPGTCYSPKDVRGIIDKLQKRPDCAKNYQVRFWETGKRYRTLGQMDIDKVILTETDNNAAMNGLTAVTVQVYSCSGPQPSPNVGFNKLEATPNLVDEIRSIIRKYNR